MHSDSLPLLTTNHPQRAMFLSLVCFHNVANPSDCVVDLVSLYFHRLTNPFSRNLFIFTSIQNPRGCALSPPFALPHELGSLVPAPPTDLECSPMNLANFIEDNREQHLAEICEFLRIPSVSAKCEHKPDTERAARWGF